VTTNDRRIVVDVQRYNPFTQRHEPETHPSETPGGLWTHQQRGSNLIVEHAAVMLAWDMGVGKTRAVIDAVNRLASRRVLVVCPKIVVDVWPEQLARWGWTGRVLALGDGSVAKRGGLLGEALADDSPLAAVVNYDALLSPKMKNPLLITTWDVVVADESHFIKAAGSKRSKFFIHLGNKARKRVCLSGTPLAHSPLDVYGQFRFLDRRVFGSSVLDFRSKYCTFGYRGATDPVPVGFKNLDDLHNRFHKLADVVKKADVLDLPPVLHETRRVDLGSEARRAYSDLEKEFVAEVRSGKITVSNALVKLLRLQQITGGVAPLDEGGRPRIDDAKAKALEELFDEIGPDEPIVVFAKFCDDLDAVKACGRTVYELSGRIHQLAAWKEAGGGAVLAVQIQAGGVGIDLTKAAYAIYYSLGYSLSDYEQSLARLDRPGQTRNVTYTHLVARRTVDERVYAALRAKRDVIRSIIEGVGNSGGADRHVRAADREEARA